MGGERRGDSAEETNMEPEGELRTGQNDQGHPFPSSLSWEGHFHT